MLSRPHFIVAIATLLLAISSAHAQLRGRVEQRSLLSASDGHLIRYNIYLPENYDNSDEFYPVIYHLHGLGGSQDGPHNTQVPQSFELAKAANLIGPVIVVFPNGYQDSWWANSANSNKPAESDVLELIPHIDSTFRTIPTPEARVIQGFSMGGFGATKFYSKFPNLFSCVVAYDGAFLNWITFLITFNSVANEVFDGNQAIFDQFSPWYWSAQNANALQSKPPVRMVVGLLTTQNRQFRNHLDSNGVQRNYLEVACGHDLGCLLNLQGQNSAAFIASHLDLTCDSCGCDSIDFNNDTSLFDPQDIDAFLSVYSEGPCVPSTATCNDIDFNNDTSVFDPCDINSFLVMYSEGPCTPCGS
ncbi:MAG: alpha/beta hydrolase-fold protein [Phycisphaerales bacterium]